MYIFHRTQVMTTVLDFPHLVSDRTAECNTGFLASCKAPSANCNHIQEMRAVETNQKHNGLITSFPIFSYL